MSTVSIESLDDIAARRNGATVIARLRWLDDRLFWQGGFRRSDLTARFGISPQQASADIATYQSLAPENALLDGSSKGYLKQEEYSPVFPKDFHAWLRSESGRMETMIPVESLRLPARPPDDAVMSAISTSYACRVALKIRYQSLTSVTPSERTICIHHVVDTGDRLHVRAWDDRRASFTDFIVGRVTEARTHPDYPWVDGMADVQWNQRVDVILGAADGLSKGQQAIIQREHGMQRGRVTIPCRKALVVYLLGRLGLIDEVRTGLTQASTGIKCLNPHELRQFLPEAAPASKSG